MCTHGEYHWGATHPIIICDIITICLLKIHDYAMLIDYNKIDWCMPDLHFATCVSDWYVKTI